MLPAPEGDAAGSGFGGVLPVGVRGNRFGHGRVDGEDLGEPGDLEEAQDARSGDHQGERSAGLAEPFEAADEGAQAGRVEEAIGRQIARLRAQRQLSLAELGEALGRYLGRTWSRQAVHQAERGQRSFTAAELTALALVLDTSVQALFRAEDGQIELPGRVISLEEYRGTLLNRENDGPLDGLEELIIALHDIGEILERPALARIARAAEQVTW
jgi:transcriptional regulator with XRE-family HTH domain